MSEQKSRDRGRDEGSGGRRRKGLAWWQLALVGLAVVAMAGGIALSLGGGGGDAGPAGGGSDLVRGLTTDGGAPAVGADAAGDDWSPVVFRLGFSAFVGFAIGYALRAFVKISVIGIGFFLLLMFGLEYAQIIEVRWASVGDRYDEAAGWIERNAGSFMGFVKGQLPAAGLFGVGLVAGLKR
jgi:uncharacterized membrane protein (Fun14 family)